MRIVIITGSSDGAFYRVPNRSHYDVEQVPRSAARNHLARACTRSFVRPRRRAKYRHTAGYVELMLHYEKPMIARVNGDVIGAGQSVMWGCDMIIAREDAIIADVHTGIGEVTNSDGDRGRLSVGSEPG